MTFSFIIYGSGESLEARRAGLSRMLSDEWEYTLRTQDPYSDYGRLQNEMWRAVRWVVDTGVHAKHWSRQQMVDFFREHTAMDVQNIETEVDRYIAWPAQALSYKMGQVKILELRAKAQKELGTKFDIRAFHDAVLDQGPLPMDVLEQKINQWIASQNRSR